MAKPKKPGIMQRFGRAVGSVAAGYESEKDATARKDVQRRILASMAKHADATEKDIARLVRKEIEAEHGADDPRLEWATAETVLRVQRALAVAALERQRERGPKDEGDDDEDDD